MLLFSCYRLTSRSHNIRSRKFVLLHQEILWANLAEAILDTNTLERCRALGRKQISHS